MIARSLGCLALSLTLSLPVFAADPGKPLAARAGIPWPAVIAHRGASHGAPESTAAAYRQALEAGADYLEMDLQRTRDGALIALHDESLLRTTDVAERFPDRKDQPVSAFTLAELKTLDAGSWFNKAYPDRARPEYVGLRIQTLEEVMAIAQRDPVHRPGLYIETKVPHLFPGIEKDLAAMLEAHGWLNAPGRIILQTFDPQSLELLGAAMPNTPRILLLWLGPGGVASASGQTFAQSGEADKATWFARQAPKSREEYLRWLDLAKAHGATGVGPSAALANGGDQSYADLVNPWMVAAAHERGLLVHVYTVDEPVDFNRVLAAGVDGIFSNRAKALRAYLQAR